ncbi:MAG: hypothetical protein ACYSOV_07800 [Planctomycetota bacterium]
MDTNQMRQISVIEPIGAAIEKTKQILFQPFDIRASTGFSASNKHHQGFCT